MLNSTSNPTYLTFIGLGTVPKLLEDVVFPKFAVVLNVFVPNKDMLTDQKLVGSMKVFLNSSSS